MSSTGKRMHSEAPGSLSRYTKRVKYVKIPPKPRHDAPSPFLQLPGELRNRIYDHAFTEEDGLHVIELGGKYRLCITKLLMPRFTQDVEANQLQYVNKQLRTETKGYGLKLNSICFTTQDASKPSPIYTCLRFLRTLAPHWLQSLSHIHIQREELVTQAVAKRHSDKYYDFDSQARLIAICERNPHLNIHWACPGWALTDSVCRFLMESASVVHAYRGGDVLTGFNFPRWFPHIDAPWEPGVSTLDRVPNFKVYPWNVCEPTEDLEERVRMVFDFCADHNSALQARRSEVEAQVWSWFIEGA
ncbi:hypothetical protein K458DRAFT_396844 [Lentithecium fluviatile CBS 122367]|uniref:Uncharacterized protein n=1 Tax=Lentithecium fluviatile CBS 122367 TaxID=1168545 RepID=A0A6G1IEL6_9PLEO|nr:hypothetical protein K458DRAFT_396844 [Lentithecium fluviatile CBS 122367]